MQGGEPFARGAAGNFFEVQLTPLSHQTSASIYIQNFPVVLLVSTLTYRSRWVTVYPYFKTLTWKLSPSLEDVGRFPWFPEGKNFSAAC